MGNGITDLDLTAGYIDVRDVIERVEWLREVRDSFVDDESVNDADAGGDAETRDEYARNAWLRDSPEDAEELRELEAILEGLRGNGGDVQWEGYWYPDTLIQDSHFEAAMDDLLGGLGVLPQAPRRHSRPRSLTDCSY